ncbi:MAG TPA: hypothetical protein VGR89_05395 [Puia sp.]|nr:hypothetical protein [Puia sp.]
MSSSTRFSGLALQALIVAASFAVIIFSERASAGSLSHRLPEKVCAGPSDPRLDKMPADLETQLALSALPASLRAAATVYLLDPSKGFYIARRGTNGFVCFVSRTEWEWGEFRKDLFAPMGFDAEGARTNFIPYLDVAAMRASGKYTARQIKDSVMLRIRKGIYKAPARSGICYMLAPVMRVYTGMPGNENVMTMSMPHYMFYAADVKDSDIGTEPNSKEGPWLVNPGNTVLGAGKGIWGYIVVPAQESVAAKIRQSGQPLVRRLAAYSPYFKLDMH